MPNDFDIASKQYDNVFTFSNIGKAQRQFVFKYIAPIIHKDIKLNILELNCGTGHDAISMASLGHTVLATDISKDMIKVAKSKECPKNLEFRIQDINTISEQSFNRKFDLIFSNFGGMNCLSKKQLDTFLHASVNLLNSGGKLVMVIMPKLCFWERLYFFIKGDLKKYKRRHSDNSVLANVGGTLVHTWYYNPKDILSLVLSLYSLKQIRPIGISIPPSYLETSFLGKPPILNILSGLETVLTGSFWAKYADHFLIELEKK